MEFHDEEFNAKRAADAAILSAVEASLAMLKTYHESTKAFREEIDAYLALPTVPRSRVGLQVTADPWDFEGKSAATCATIIDLISADYNGHIGYASILWASDTNDECFRIPVLGDHGRLGYIISNLDRGWKVITTHANDMGDTCEVDYVEYDASTKTLELFFN